MALSAQAGQVDLMENNQYLLVLPDKLLLKILKPWIFWRQMRFQAFQMFLATLQLYAALGDETI